MIDVLIAEPGELSPEVLDSGEILVRSAFGDGFRTHDWLHGVDGVHVLITEDRELLAHSAVVPRTLRHAGDVFDTGYVEGVAVRGDQQGRGLGRLVMDHTEAIIRARHGPRCAQRRGETPPRSMPAEDGNSGTVPPRPTPPMG